MEKFTKEQQKRVEELFKLRCIALKIKFKSKIFYKTQLEFFIGAISVLESTEIEYPPIWFICISSNREIIEY